MEYTRAMSLVTRLTIGFLIVVICIISLHQYWQYDESRDDFEDDMDRSHLLVATGFHLLGRAGALINHYGMHGGALLQRFIHGGLQLHWRNASSPCAPAACR